MDEKKKIADDELQKVAGGLDKPKFGPNEPPCGGCPDPEGEDLPEGGTQHVWQD